MTHYIALKDNSVKHTAYYIIEPSNVSKDYFEGSNAFIELKKYVAGNGGTSIEVRRGSKVVNHNIKGTQ